jgi:hypothetical protein
MHFWVLISRAVISSYSLRSNIFILSIAAGQGLRHILVRCSLECLAKFVYHTETPISTSHSTALRLLNSAPAHQTNLFRLLIQPQIPQKHQKSIGKYIIRTHTNMPSGKQPPEGETGPSKPNSPVLTIRPNTHRTTHMNAPLKDIIATPSNVMDTDSTKKFLAFKLLC